MIAAFIYQSQRSFAAVIDIDRTYDRITDDRIKELAWAINATPRQTVPSFFFFWGGGGGGGGGEWGKYIRGPRNIFPLGPRWLFVALRNRKII